MKCHESLERIQRRLDGEALPLTPDWKTHLEACSACKESYQAAQLLMQGLKRSAPPVTMPASLTSRIVQRAVEDRKHRQARAKLRWIAIWTMAASVLLLVGLTSFVPRNAGVGPIVQQRPPESTGPERATPTLDLSVQEAKHALTTLSERVADSTKENAKHWWNAALPQELPTMANLAAVDDWDESLEPTTESLRNAGKAMAQGFQPVARSAVQAFDFFSKELASLELTAPQ